MSLIKIIANGIELDYVKETLKLKVENNGFSSSFKAKHNSFPFLIIENEKAKLALGSNDITSLNKNKVVEVEIYELDDKYYGQLLQLSFIEGFRKCDLRYGSDLLKITNKKISEFMPVVSVIPGETNPVQYAETANELVPGFENWQNYPTQFLNLGFPNAKWQFPKMSWRNKFGENLETTDEWYNFSNEINSYSTDLTSFLYNSFQDNGADNYTIFQKYVPSLQVYLLSPLFFALAEIGFKITGDFYTHEFIKRILFLSTKDNLTRVPLTASISYQFINGFTYNNDVSTYETFVEIPLSAWAFSFYIDWEMELRAGETITLSWETLAVGEGGNAVQQGLLFFSNNSIDHQVVSGSILIENNVSPVLHIIFGNVNAQHLPYSYSIKIRNTNVQSFMQFHPTINTGRYLPDWNFGKYLNELQKTFNLEIIEDSFQKKLSINFIEEGYFESLPLVLDKSFKIEAKDIVSNNSFILKYKNDTDLAVIITQDGTNVYNGEQLEFSTKIESEFKEVDFNYVTASLSEALESKEGTGLMIYDSATKPYVKNTWGSFNLSISLDGGIFNTFYKKTLRIRLLASGIEIEGAFTKTELSKIKKTRTIYFDNQKFIITSYDFSESTNFFIVKMKLETVIY